ncbi:MAG TPA: glutamate--tRNA ligase [Syntrophomonadaceae bacterium]|nr:glutamate--tRNA ligase [Syntrophomonadaceae bacterium]
MVSDIRVRFAPSPTGSLHIGGARTALFNWLFARSQGGVLVLRLEDTDADRSTEESAAGIVDGLRWLGLDWDEGPLVGGPYGPYRQSQRLEAYQTHLHALVAAGKAYYCFCTAEELQKEKNAAQIDKLSYKYPGHCRLLTPEQVQENLAQGKRAVIRLKVPESGTTIVEDLVRGRVEFANNLVDDFIIAKSDGWPTYNFAVVVDDHSMKISHVIRAEEHLSNTPKQIFVYRAMGWSCPTFAHVSMILSPDRSKLSKRHGATSVQEFRDLGYLPEALINYLVLLGWSSGEDRDFWTLQNMIDHFRLDNISRSPAVYDTEKLTWMNGHYLAQADPHRLALLLGDEAERRSWPVKDSPEYFLGVIKLLQSRAKTIRDILEQADYFFEDPNGYDDKGIKKYFLNGSAMSRLQTAEEITSSCTVFHPQEIENCLRTKAEELGIKAADLIHPIRLAVSGRINTPGLFEVMELLGREQCLKRIGMAKQWIQNHS